MGQQGEELTYRQMVEQQVEARRTIHELYERSLVAERKFDTLRNAVSYTVQELDREPPAMLSDREQRILRALKCALGVTDKKKVEVKWSEQE